MESASLKLAFVDPEIDGAQVLGRYDKQAWWDGVGNGIYKDDNTPISWVKASDTANWAGMGCSGEGEWMRWELLTVVCACAGTDLITGPQVIWPSSGTMVAHNTQTFESALEVSVVSYATQHPHDP